MNKFKRIFKTVFYKFCTFIFSILRFIILFPLVICMLVVRNADLERLYVASAVGVVLTISWCFLLIHIFIRIL